MKRNEKKLWKQKSQEIEELFYRVMEGDLGLLDNPDVTTVKDVRGATALHKLADAKYLGVLQHPEVATVRDNSGRTPLHYLAEAGCDESLAHPMVATSVDIRNVTPLHHLAGYGHIEAIRHSGKCLRDKGNNTPLHYFASRMAQRAATARFASLKPSSKYSLDPAIVKEFLEIPEAATAKNNRGETPLQYLRREKVIDVLSSKEIEMNFEIEQLFRGARQSDLRLLDHPEVAIARDEFGNTPLHELASQGWPKVLEHPMVAEVQNLKGRTPLHELAATGYEIALSHKEVASLKDLSGVTPLHLLASSCCQKALDHKQVATVADTWGVTPLHFYAESGGLSALSHPQASKVRDRNGDTPMHYFAKFMVKSEEEIRDRTSIWLNPDFARTMMRHPDVATAKNNKGVTPFDILKENKLVNEILYKHEWPRTQESQER